MERLRRIGLTSFIRSVLGAWSFPLRVKPLSETAPQVYQPSVVPKPSPASPPPPTP